LNLGLCALPLEPHHQSGVAGFNTNPIAITYDTCQVL
jgi:hypothetical protein